MELLLTEINEKMVIKHLYIVFFGYTKNNKKILLYSIYKHKLELLIKYVCGMYTVCIKK